MILLANPRTGLLAGEASFVRAVSLERVGIEAGPLAVNQ
jgi:hypothetical protein